MFLDSATFLRDFGVSATVGGVACRGIFDAAWADTLGMGNTRPQLLVATADLPALAVGAAVTVPAGAYTVQSIEPDGTGMATLILRRAS